MKKALALVLALVLALSMGVSAFAALDFNDYVDLEDVSPADPAKTVIKTDLNFTEIPTDTLYVNTYEGGKLYMVVDLDLYENLEVSSTGNTSIKVVEYNPETMVWMEGTEEVLTYSVYFNDGGDLLPVGGECPDFGNGCYVDKIKNWGANPGVLTADGWTTEDIEYHWEYAHEIDSTELKYEDAKDLEELLNEAHKDTRFVKVCDQNVAVLEIVVDDNYSAHFTEGSFTVKATGVDDEKPYSATIKVINDVIIFAYENVKSAAKYDTLLTVGGFEGYSDYWTYKNGYVQADLPIVEDSDSVVISTTAFRAIEGKDLDIQCGNMLVEIDPIAKAQKGVNFCWYEEDTRNAAGVLVSYDFGFYGDQVIGSDFKVTLETEYTWFSLRDDFKVKVEEEDIIDYYVLKDGKLVQTITVDYMTIDYNDTVKVEIEGKAGETLGQYQIVREVPAEEEAPAEEENPNTGAESVVGVVAALAVVSLASAAAVSLKK